MKCYSAFFLHKPKYVLSSKLPLLSPHFYISSWFSQANPARSHHISRTVEEFKKGHVQTEKILNIPYMFNTPEGRVKNPKFLNEVSAVCKEEDHLVVGCQSGVRSLSATADLLNAGFKDASNMGGGYIAWVQNGFPLKVEEEEKAQL
ncbi:hypothetical protein MANES_01G147900v8 [Manihot esculenta]|uniref:Uncharacterized protein n=1 Tax=Manihot esculenta TaxID=3983 RepID=A0ACB7IF41_MANES|nr:hypothetical protein MANES_01G147900v8 [Manihot esculenta]